MNAFEFSAVSKHFGSRVALDEVELALTSGSALGLLGPNGAGKTTALRLLLGFVPATRGKVLLQGLDPQDPKSRRSVGYLPERIALPGRMTVEAFLKLHGRLAGLEGHELMAEVERVAERTGVADRRADRLGGLSKGLAQRVGFAQAFLAEPQILILDEPTSGLDPIGMREAREWIEAEHARGCTVLISSHVLSEIERICDRVAILGEGRILIEGGLDSIVEDGEELEDAFIRHVRAGASGDTGGAR